MLKCVVDQVALMFYNIEQEGCTDTAQFERVKVFRWALFHRMNSPCVRNGVWMVSKVIIGH